MPKIMFRAAHIRYVDVRHKEEAGVFVRLHMTAEYSTHISDHFGWPSDMDESITQCKLAGEIAAVSMVLTPNDPALMRHEIQIECRDVSDFNLIGLREKDSGEITRHELRFVVQSGQVDAEALAGAWLRTIGSGTGNLYVLYTDQMPLEDQASNQAPLAAESEDGDDAPLPSVTMMAGNTDQLKKERRKRQRPEGKGLEPRAEVASGRPVPGTPGPEWRTAEEIAAGVPLYHGKAN